jgi:phosphonoacetaldehyde hydrolase
MNFTHLRAVVLDWAGTTVDHGSLAPVVALERVFAANGVEIAPAEARKDMGVLKKDQIRFILAGDRVNRAWQAKHGGAPAEEDVERMYTEFIPKQAGVLAEYSAPIPGVCETVESWKAAGLRIGSTTGYPRQLLDTVQSAAAQQGYLPDASVTPDEVGTGRPAPFMCYRNAILLGVYPLSCCVKIGDTPTDIAEGLNAGMWTIALTDTGNEIGLSLDDWAALPSEDRVARTRNAAQRLMQAGAHYTAGSLAGCPEILADIERRLAAGEKP